MYLSSVGVENFRNLKDCRLDLTSGLNVLVGRNNVGKSNLIDAIRHALGPAASAGDLPGLQRQDFRDEGGSPQPMRITLTFSGMNDQDRTTFFEMLVPNLQAIERSSAQLVFEATWGNRNRPQTRRWCGPGDAASSAVPNAILEALPVTFLPALRDAEAALTPGYKNRLARLFDALAGDKDRAEILNVYEQANSALEGQTLVTNTVQKVRASAERMSGSDYRQPSIRAAEPEITRILRSLRLTIDGTPIADIAGSGLGYQNILYVATVLTHLTTAMEQDCPLLIVEEPEAHLHPQLVVLLADSLSEHQPGAGAPQTIVTTHSPAFAAHVGPSQLRVMISDADGHGQVESLAEAGLEDAEARAIKRMMDVTRSALYFAKGVILVEGVSEALLLPTLAKQLGYDLPKAHVSVIPICGVGFSTLAKVLGPNALQIPVAIVTDGDPGVEYAEGANGNWKLAHPKQTNGAFEECDRLHTLRGDFKGHENVAIFSSQVTLEYDLASAGDRNADSMAEVWESLFKGTPGTLTKTMLEGMERAEKALSVWRGVCVAKTSGSKADFAHRLAAALDGDLSAEMSEFVVPSYIKEAVEFVVARAESGNSTGAGGARMAPPNSTEPADG